jgi:hypothetical protein
MGSWFDWETVNAGIRTTTAEERIRMPPRSFSRAKGNEDEQFLLMPASNVRWGPQGLSPAAFFEWSEVWKSSCPSGSKDREGGI